MVRLDRTRSALYPVTGLLLGGLAVLAIASLLARPKNGEALLSGPTVSEAGAESRIEAGPDFGPRRLALGAEPARASDEGSVIEGEAPLEPAPVPVAPGKIPPPPPESAVIRAIDRYSIPPEARARLDARMAAKKPTGAKAPPPLPPVDPDEPPTGIARPLGGDRIISRVKPWDIPFATEKRLEGRTESRTAPN